MVEYCLDTGIVIALLRKQTIVKRIELLELTNEFFITPITLCELYKGVYRSQNLHYELSILHELLETLSVYDFSRESCRIFGEDFVRLQKSGQMVDDFDVMIASIAKAHGAVIVTRNKKHFAHTGAKVEEW